MLSHPPGLHRVSLSIAGKASQAPNIKLVDELVADDDAKKKTKLRPTEDPKYRSKKEKKQPGGGKLQEGC